MYPKNIAACLQIRHSNFPFICFHNMNYIKNTTLPHLHRLVTTVSHVCMIIFYFTIFALKILSIFLAISTKSFSFLPRVVSAGVPRRIPDGSNGLRVSVGMVLKLQMMLFFSRLTAASLPLTPLPSIQVSIKIRWVSVPPEIILQPNFFNSSAKTFAFFTTCFVYFFINFSRIFFSKDDSATRTPKSLVGSRGNHIGILEWTRIYFASNKTSKMRHVNH